MKKQNQSLEEFERIERYLAGLMTREEQSVFEGSLKSDPKLKRQVEEIRLLQSAVEEQSLRDKLDDFHEEMLAKDTNHRREIKQKNNAFNFKILTIAASLALLMGFGYWLLFAKKSADEKLFAQYFQPDPGLITPMSTSTDYDFYRAMVDYKQGKYREAIYRWNPLLKQKPDNDTLNFYLGVSFLAKDETEKAVGYLSKTIQHPDSKFINEAWYYLGMAQLKQEQTNKAIASFQKSNFEKSRLILNEIKKME